MEADICFIKCRSLKFKVLMEIYFELYCVFMISFFKVSNGCDDGWFKHERYCYFFQNKLLKGKSWSDALSSCQVMGAHLLSIEDGAENSYIKKKLEDDSIKKGYYWIGLNADREFKWSDNKHSNFSNWLPKRPDSYLPGENCVETNKIGWNDKNCYDYNGFICKFLKENNGSCPHGWISYKIYCYLFQNINESLNKYDWFDSYSSCLSKGGNLLTVEDQQENSFVTSILESDGMKDQHFWIVVLPSVGSSGRLLDEPTDGETTCRRQLKMR
ncbi:snaclec 3-like [Hydra vulgaris]|uniref:Snaclec 3-like n=1 Tax=Hydra vulgaris TaxID=6087 RepID=A0ABM4CMQ2_HYDVU